MKKTILFDFDGVIVDSFETCYGVSELFNPGKTFTRDEYKQFFNGNVYESVNSHDKKETKVPVDDPWFAEYTKRILDLEPVNGMKETVSELASHFDLSIISSSLSNSVQRYLDKYDLGNYFDEVLGADVHKSKLVKIHNALNERAIESENALFITDTLGDIREARKAGVNSLAVTWGFHHHDHLQIGNPSFIVSDPKEISQRVFNYFMIK